MEEVTVSPNYQVVIPRKVRQMLHIQRGQKLQVIAYNNRVVLIPSRSIREARGTLQGLSLEGFREDREEERP